jgi:hypothetical protein
MRIKRYLEFITEEFVSKDTKVNWGEAEFEVKEMFRIFNDLRDGLPNEVVIGGEKFVLDKSIFGTVGKAMDLEPDDFEIQVEDINRKHTDPSKELRTTSEDLLRKTTYTLKNGEKVDAKPYHEFIKLCRKLFWTGSKIQLDESGVKKLADDSQTIGRGDFAHFLKDAGEYQRLKVSYDKTMEFLKSKGAEDRLNTPQVFKDFPDIDKEAYSEACQFVSYYGGSFDFFDKNIENGGKMPLTSAIEIGGKWYIVGGNRRMTYYVLSGINPTIWLIKL